MKKLLLAVILLAFPLHLYAAQITLDTAVDATLDGNAGDETGEDLRLTIFGALGDQNTMNTELYTDKANVSDIEYADLSSTTFDVTGTGTSSDHYIYTLKGFGAASNSTYPIKNSSGIFEWVSLVSGSGTVTVQADDPTSASATGWYAATTSGDIFYKSDDGLFTIAGSYAADPVTYSLTMAITDTTGTGSYFTLNTVNYDVTDSPISLTGLDGGDEITFTPNSTETASCTGTGITGTDETGPWTLPSDDVTDMACTVSESVTYTTALSSVWDGSDALDTGGSGTAMPWYSEIDTNSIGDLSGGKYVVSSGTNGQVARLREQITARDDISVSVDITASSVSGWGNNAAIDVMSAGASLRLSADSSGNLDNIKVSYQNGAGSWVFSDSYTYAFDTSEHTFEMRFLFSSDTGTSDGSVSVLVDDVVVIGPTAINTNDRNSGTNLYVGVTGNSQGMGSNSLSFDNVVFGYK